MKIILRIILLISISSFFACENEVEINADYTDITTVYGLLEPSGDTQFVKVTRTFLDDNQNAVQLASQADRIYYDSLNIRLIEKDNNGVVLSQTTFQDTVVPKDAGFFTQDNNVIYYTTNQINEKRNYELEITKPDGSITKGKVRTTDGVSVTKPTRNNQTISFVSPFNQSLSNYQFEFETGDNIGEFEAKVTFMYTEIDNNDSTHKIVTIPLATFSNPSLSKDQKYKFTLEGTRFFNAVEAAIPVSANPPKRIWQEKSIEIEVYAADADYSLYRDVNGPIDGLSQTRTEFTNIENGIGLFASRQKVIRRIQINDDTKSYIIANYGDLLGNAAKYRGFVFP